MFDIRLNDEQRAYQQLAREFAENEIKPLALDLDRKPNWEERIPWEVLKKGSQLGFRTFVLKEENGGAGASDHLTACLIAEELAAADPDAVVVLPCGFDLARTRRELPALASSDAWRELRAVRAGRAFLADGCALMNRPGPRLVLSLEVLAEILHPEEFAPRHRGRWWEAAAEAPAPGARRGG